MEGTTVVTSSPTPATTTPGSTPAAPATSAPTPAAVTSERPKTFAEAFARDAAPAPDPSTPQDTATIPPVEATPAESVPPVDPGPIPFTVHKTALDNARTKAVAEYREKHGWAEQVSKEQFDRLASVAHELTTDPIAHLAKLHRELAAHPVYGPQLKSQAARALGARTPAAPDFTPDVQVVNEQGQVTGATYSADKLKAILEHTVAQRVAPLEQQEAARKTADQRAEATAKALEARKQTELRADKTIARMDKQLGITKDTPPALRDELLRAVVAELDKGLDHEDAILAVYEARVLPTLTGKAQAQVLEDLKTKAAAQGVNPASAVIASAKRPGSFHDPSLKW